MNQYHSPQRSASEATDIDSVIKNIHFGATLDPEIFNGIAQKAAESISKPLSPPNSNKSTQLRRFYDELVLWEMRGTQHPDKFDEYLPFIRMVNAKAAYAEGRKLVDKNFVALLSHTLKEVTNPATLTTCKLFWEAFMGFYKLERGND